MHVVVLLFNSTLQLRRKELNSQEHALEESNSLKCLGSGRPCLEISRGDLIGGSSDSECLS